MVETVNVVVVGGGAAGLAAAAEIEARGLTCQLLEAQSRLGGRVQTARLPGGGAFDRGAQMVNTDMTAVLDVTRRAGIDSAVVPRAGADLAVLGERVVPREELVSAEEIYDFLESQVVRWDSPREILRAIRQTYRWWTTPWEDAGEAGRAATRAVSRSPAPRESLAAALEAMLLCADDAAIARSTICELCGAAPEVLDAVAVRAAASTYASERDAVEVHFPGGMGQVIAALAGRLVHTPRLGAPVGQIYVDRDGVDVIAARGRIRADHVVVAVPPPAARRIGFQMEGAGELRALLDAFEAGDMIKTVLVYDRAFWRRHGRSGAVTFADPPGLEVMETTLGDGSAPRLTAFLGGPEARSWSRLSAEDRRARLLHHLGRAFGPEAMRPVDVAEAVWIDDPWSGGGYNATVRVGHCRDAVPRLAQRGGRVRFAGAELADTFWGHVEGAIRSGRAVGRDVGRAVGAAVEARA
ncbi:MAG: FAD-dependent oxidoreductase [Pseudomonadota bacterium]